MADDEWTYNSRRKIYRRRESCTVIPAQPGFAVVEPVYGDDNDIVSLSFSPILAWAIAVTSEKDLGGDIEVKPDFPVPITIEGGQNFNSSVEWAIARPDGKISFVMEGDYETKEEVLKDFQRRHEDAKAEKAKAKAETAA